MILFLKTATSLFWPTPIMFICCYFFGFPIPCLTYIILTIIDIILWNHLFKKYGSMSQKFGTLVAMSQMSSFYLAFRLWFCPPKDKQ